MVVFTRWIAVISGQLQKQSHAAISKTVTQFGLLDLAQHKESNPSDSAQSQSLQLTYQ